MKKITVLGIGNILLQDEGFGVRVVENLLQRFKFPDYVQVIDGGTVGMGLMPFLDGSDRLIIIDAVSGSLPPGGVYELKGNDVKAYFKNKVSLHEMGIQDVLATLELLEKPVSEVIVFGIQPAVVDVGLELTQEIRILVPRIADMVIQQLENWKVEVVSHG